MALVGFGAAVLASTAFSCFAARPAGPDLTIPRDLAGAPIVRVALAQQAPKVTLEVRGPYAIFGGEETGLPPQFAGESLPPTDATAEGDALVLGRTLFRPGIVRIAPKRPGTLVVDGTAYRGEVVLRARREGGVIAVNRVNLEEYTAGVVGSEMPLAFPDAALRAQAIASRTYALYQLKTRAAGALWDVTNDTLSQVYKGLTNETEKARQVTTETLGVVMTHRGLLFASYFHSTCGGATIPASFELGDLDIEPLMGVPCGFCEDSKYAHWEAAVGKAELAERLRREGIAVRAVRAVEVLALGPAGHVATVRVVHEDGELRVKGSRFRMIAGPSVLRSTLFSAEDAGDRVVFRGRGWGHAVGLCQIGARGMAREGYEASAILRRYYPGAELVRLYAAPPTGGT
jgi:stage II sporulation protein D